jgi:hypothetical protein
LVEPILGRNPELVEGLFPALALPKITGEVANPTSPKYRTAAKTNDQVICRRVNDGERNQTIRLPK